MVIRSVSGAVRLKEFTVCEHFLGDVSRAVLDFRHRCPVQRQQGAELLLAAVAGRHPRVTQFPAQALCRVVSVVLW